MKNAANFVFYFLFICCSGNTDAVIPVTSTRYSINALKLPTVSPWRAWYDDGQVIISFHLTCVVPLAGITHVGYVVIHSLCGPHESPTEIP